MDGAGSKNAPGDDNLQDQSLPLPVQIFLWRQLSPFIRPKLGKHHEATCMFCQQAPGHHEMKEACKSYEKVIVQNIQYGLSVSLTEGMTSIPRWRLIQAAYPHVMHCAAHLLQNRKDTHLQSLGATETKILYTLHWIILLAAEECADADHEQGIYQNSPFYYLFSVPSITLFIYLFAPIFHNLKESDFQTFRLENGLKMWQALWEFRHPDTPCFTAQVKPKPRMLYNPLAKGTHLQFGDVFLGRQPSSDEAAGPRSMSPLSPSASFSYSAEQLPGASASAPPQKQEKDEDGSWVSSPKDTVFPETIPEESSSPEDEHVVIFRLPSLTDDTVERTYIASDASVFHVLGMDQSMTPSVSHYNLTPLEHVVKFPSSVDVRSGKTKPPPIQKMGSSTDKESVSSKDRLGSLHKLHASAHSADVCAATFLDVAVLRCLFMSHWPEEGVYWALQFYYHRLREMSEETGQLQMPRRRSNSLPIPKIEISLYHSPEMNKRESFKDLIELPEEKDTSKLAESFYFAKKNPVDTTSHTRRASEKSKRKMKIADLRTFVETKILSKSEKALENMGQDGSPKAAPFHHDHHHHSLDAGDDHLTRPNSSLSKTFDLPAMSHLGWGTLVKGKSMPSLRFTSGNESWCSRRGLQEAHSHAIMNPIITVTQHSPLPSPDGLKRQSSMDSQLDGISQQGNISLPSYEERKPSLTRSHTDSNITYACEEVPEAPGATNYITKEGDVDIHVVLKAVHSVALRGHTSCTLRVCEVIFNLLELLMDMGVLKKKNKEDTGSGGSQQKEDTTGEPENKQHFPTAKSLHEQQYSAHNLLLNTVLRVYKHLGCSHGCGEGLRGPPADFLRSQGQSILVKLHHNNQTQFAKFLRDFVREQTLADVLDFFHAYLGFCVDPTSLLSPLNQKRSSSKSPDGGGQGYATNFGQGLRGRGNRGVQGHILSSVFKTLVSRLVKSTKQLKTQENVPLYCDVRQLMTFVKEAHGGVFRKVALSGLLDSISQPEKQTELQTTRVIKHMSHVDPADEHDQAYFIDEKGHRKLLFKKKSSSSAHGGGMEGEGDEGSKSQSPIGNLRRRAQPTLTPRHSEKNLGMLAAMVPLRAAAAAAAAARQEKQQPKLMPKIGGIVSWFKKEHGHDSIDSHDEREFPVQENIFQRQQSIINRGLAKSTSKGSSGDLKQALQKTKKRVEDQIKKNFGFRKGKKKDGSLEDNSGSYMSRRNSTDPFESSRDSDYVVFRERKLVALTPVLNGMKRFQFLLETCQPGSVPDQHLMAALLDLPNAPVVARAAILLECAFFVHNLNKGQWPSWMMKLNFSVSRPSMPQNVRNNPSGQRRAHIMQRSAGKLFYQWAEAIGARLEEMLLNDKRQIPDIVAMMSDESKQKELLLDDEEEDFLDEASVNFSGNECPVALRMIACILLLEITAFLRETYQGLPKSSRGSAKDRPPPWERMYSREANRRWSMALSSMGHSQASAQSLQSIAGEAGGQTERKISFVLHEPDNESEGSSKSTVTVQGEDGGGEDKHKKDKRPSTSQPPSRPLLLRRGTNSNTTGSFKRRSLKLRRGTKEGLKEVESDFKRADSIQSKRKVSSLSDRSDTSEPGAGGEVSGDESPGVLSDDQPPESPSDSNETDETSKNMSWLKVVVQVTNSFNFYCSHQNFCHPYCYRRQMRACDRLMYAVRKVYGEKSDLFSTFDMGTDKDKDGKKDKSGRGRKVSDQGNLQTSPVKRKSSLGKKDRLDNSKHRDSDQDVEKNIDFDAKDKSTSGKAEEPLPMLKYLKTQVRNVFHAPLALLVKGAVVLPEELFIDIIPVAWELLLESDQEVAASAASLFILCAVRAPNHASDVMSHALSNTDVTIKINAILRFQVLWKLRYQVWPRMEEGAHCTFKVPPPGIEFTLPSPKIGLESVPVVDPPWLPNLPKKVEEVSQEISRRIVLPAMPKRKRSLVTATKTRKKRQTEMMTIALQAQEDKKREDRENFIITMIPITEQAAHQASQIHVPGEEHEEGKGDEDQNEMGPGRMTHHTNAVHSLFPSCLCSAVIQIITLLDDCAVSPDGTAVYEVAHAVTWNCLVEDSPLFLRYVLERITREKQDQMFKVLRHLFRFIPRLPQQAAFSMYNYIIGYIMFYVRSCHEDGQMLIGTALSVLWMVVHSVHGIMFKDLKQILRKEQCDATILLNANIPSAKKIVVHGPHEADCGGIPSQFPIQEDTQFCQILRESLDFFSIDESLHKEYFLVDHKTRQIHNPLYYVRDFYFFKRSQYPQLELVHMQPEDAFNALQKQELVLKLVEIGKVLLTWAILKNVDLVVQRVVFLHEELNKLPSFPRKALESDLDLYNGGELGKVLHGLDMLHKFMWVRLIARMFEAMANNYTYSSDLHLFINVLNGTLILHGEDSCILRYVAATYINGAINFKTIFSSNGYMLIMPTLLQIYSNYQTNKLVTRTIEYCVKQFYLLHRKPFILQMFGSLSAILDTDEDGACGEAHKVQAKCLFQLLLSLETPSPDPLSIGELVKAEKPLKAVDFCYHDEDENVTVLDCISLCIMVVAFNSDSHRGHQMLVILEAILPYYLQEIQTPGYEKEGRTEREIIQQLASAIRTLVHNCESLTKNYSGPMTSPVHRNSKRRQLRGYSPGYEYDEEDLSQFLMRDHSRDMTGDQDMTDIELIRTVFRRPRDIVLSLVSEFYFRASARCADGIKAKAGFDSKPVELLDTKSHVRLVDISMSLLKAAPYDCETMGCRGLQKYMVQLLPYQDWSNDNLRPALMNLLRRLDKMFLKIYRRAPIRRNIDWDAAAGILKGIYELLLRFPAIVHLAPVKTIVNTCQLLLMGDTNNLDMSDRETVMARAYMALLPPPQFISIAIKTILVQMLSMGDNYTLENVCGGNSIFPDKKKTESTLMNLVIPICLRGGGGRADVPQLRSQDISYVVNAILHAMNPPASKTQPVTAQTIKSFSEMRSSSLAPGKEPKKPVRLPQSTYQVAFLALKTVIVSFENNLGNDWTNIARNVKEVGKIWDLGNVFWDFLDFVATYRNPLFVLLRPFIHEKVHSPPLNDSERHMQFVIKERLKSFSVGQHKCRAALLAELLNELKNLRDELETGRTGDRMDNFRSGDTLNVCQPSDGHTRNHRPSLIGLFSDVLMQKRPSSDNPAGMEANRNSHHDMQLKPIHAQRDTITVVNEKREEIHVESHQPASSSTSPPRDKERLFHRHRGIKLRFVPNVVVKDIKGGTSTTPISPGSPGDDSSTDMNGSQEKSKLQRSKAQSRKTFRLRRSRKSRLERLDNLSSNTEKISYSTPATPTQVSAQSQQEFLEQLRQQKERLVREAEEKRNEISRRNQESFKKSKISPGLTDASSSRQAVSPTTTTASSMRSSVSPAASSIKSSVSPTLSSIESRDEKAATQQSAAHAYSVAYPNYRATHQLKQDLSFEDDTSVISQTSSTSGYRESCSLMTMTMESPTLLRPSSLPGTTSPDSSLTSNGCHDETAVMARSSSSQHSLLMLFEAQDEDTLI